MSPTRLLSDSKLLIEVDTNGLLCIASRKTEDAIYEILFTTLEHFCGAKPFNSIVLSDCRSLNSSASNSI